MVVPDVGGMLSGDEGRRSLIRRAVGHRKGGDTAHPGSDRLQVDAPLESAVGAFQIGHQKRGDPGIVDLFTQFLLQFRPPVIARQIEHLHGRDVVQHVVAIGHRRDIDDDEPFQQAGLIERETHRDLAAHGMPEDDRIFQSRAVNEPGHVLRHFLVGHRRRARRGAVIAEIERVDAMGFGKRPGDPGPVAGGTEQPVHHDQRRAVCTVFVAGEFKHDREVSWRRRLVTFRETGSGSLVHHLAAVDGHDVAGEIARPRRQQEDNAGRDLVGGA